MIEALKWMEMRDTISPSGFSTWWMIVLDMIQGIITYIRGEHPHEGPLEGTPQQQD